MRPAKAQTTRLTFADLITTLMSQLSLSPEGFCVRFGVSSRELRAVLDGEPISPDVPLRLAAALDWPPGEIEKFLAKAGPIPLEGDLEFVDPSAVPPPGAIDRDAPDSFLRAQAYANPLTCELERIDVLRPIEPFNQAYADQHLLGRK